jgi:hypothetical protein
VVQGGVTNLVNLVTHKVVAGGPSHMGDRPWSLASTDLQLRIPLYRLLESVTEKPTCERLQGGAGRPGGLASRPPPSTISSRPLYTDSSCQVHPRGDTYLGGIPNFIVIS